MTLEAHDREAHRGLVPEDAPGSDYRGGGESSDDSPLSCVPFMRWMQEYNIRQDLWPDIVSGLTVGVLLVPQSLAYAVLADIPPSHGLYASFTPLLAYTFLGSGIPVGMGPAALMSLMVAAALPPDADEQQRKDWAALLALGMGVVCVLMGFLRMGVLVHFLSPSVMRSFSCAAALIIIINQLAHVLALSIPNESTTLSLFHTVMLLHETHLPTLLMSIGLALILWLGERLVIARVNFHDHVCNPCDPYPARL